MNSFLKNLFGKKKESPQTQEEPKKTFEDNIKIKNSLSLGKEDIKDVSTSNYATEPNNQISTNEIQNNKNDNISVHLNMSESNNNVNSTQEPTTNKKSFAFLNKNKKTFNEGNINSLANDNRASLPDFNTMNTIKYTSHEEVSSNKPGKAGFAFLKSKKNSNVTEEASNLKMDDSIKKTAEYNLQLQNILNDENLLSVISSNMQENQALEEKLDNKDSMLSSPIDNEINLNNNLNKNQIENSQSENKNKTFNFIKKKNAPAINPSGIDRENEMPKSNLEELNNVSNTDINSDTKSFKSLKINNNFKNENISVILDTGNDEDGNRSVITDNYLNLNNLGNKGGFKFLKNKETNKPSFLKKKEEPEGEKEMIKKDLEVNKIRDDEEMNLSPVELKVKCYEEFLKGNEIMKDLFIRFHNLKKIGIFKEKEKLDLNNELDHLINQENIAIERNDFEEAQAIENKIQDLKTSLEKIDDDKDSFNNEQIELRNEELKILKNKEKLLEETSKKLLKLRNKQQNEIDNFTNNELAKHKNDNIKIKKLVEKLQFLKTDLEEKKAFIDEEEEKINNVIKSQSVEIFQDLDKLKENRSEIQKEIEELESILAKKYSELDSVCKQIENKEGEIDEIKSTYSHEFNKINSKKKNYEEKLKDYNEQNITLDEMKAAYDENQIILNNKSSSMNNFIAEIEKEINEMKNVIGNIDSELTKRENLLKNENSIDAKIRLIDISLKRLKEKIKASENEINYLEGSVKKLETDLISIDIKLPRLEEEKKAYVSSKNFKEAGRVSNELKLLNDTKIKNFEFIKSNQERILELKEEITTLDKEYANIEKEKTEYFVEKNITRYEYLICYSKQLKEFIDEYVSKSEYARVNTDSKSLYSENLYNLNEEVEYVNEEIAKLENLDYIQEKFDLNKEMSNQEISESIHLNILENQIKSEESISEEKALTHKNNEEDNIEEDQNQEGIEEVNLNNAENTTENNEEIYNLEELQMKLNDLDRKLEECVEREDFDQADLIQNQINEINDLIDNKA